MMKARRFHRKRRVRLHASGKWICTIGVTLSLKTGKLVDKDWYFAGSEASAIEKANAKARQWELLCTNWDKTERPHLELFGDPLPYQPRWRLSGHRAATPSLPPDALQQMRREGVIDSDEFAEALLEFTFSELIPVYKTERGDEAKLKDVQNTTVTKDVSQMKQAARFLPNDIPFVKLTGEQFREAKKQMLAKYARRTASNYLKAAVKLLTWAYGRYGGDEARLPTKIEEAIIVRDAHRRNIKVHGTDALKALLKELKGTICQMDALLCLNCGMYPGDIGRLLLDEIDLAEGSVFWDREKEPDNNFRVYHLLWPETLAAVKRYLNDGRQHVREFKDFRHGLTPAGVDVRQLAFLDDGRPRYLIKPGGSAYDLVGRRWGRMKTGVHLRNLRKTANDALVGVINHGGGDEELLSVNEISNRFLGQKTKLLVSLYQTNGKSVYRRMNHFLTKLGDHLRDKGVFEHLDQ